ncbi:hypothetical protein GCM10023186_11680 [Hymenobacter koreensis]|uniref:CUB domain-containing protein n=2 Tax=Hymenobacter koreensis TaxID=1084523 RepID=A0ABP8IWE1_9BACT
MCLLLACLGLQASAQTYQMPTSGSASITTCSGTLYDSGGANGPYTNGENSTLTISPAISGNKIRLIFSQFEVESGYDRLFVYDGASTSAPLLGSFDSNFPPGTLYASNATGALTLRLTSDGVVNLNGFTAAVGCVTSVPQADLAVQGAVVTPGSTVAGGSVNVSSNVVNLAGVTASSSNLGYYLSTNNTLDAGDVLLGSSFGGALAAGQSSSRLTQVFVPASTTPGSYFVLFVADHQNQVNESNETNNVAAAALVVTQPAVDLVIQQPGLNPAVTTPGAFVNFACSIFNQGNATAASSSVGYYLSTNTTLDANDQLLTASFGGTLTPGFPSSRFAGINIPASTTPGSYFVLYVADYQNQVSETNESNNVASVQLVVTTPNVDLLVQQEQLSPSSVTAGNAVSAGAFVFNQGTTAAASSSVGFYLSTDTNLDANDQLLSAASGTTLGASQTSYRSATLTIPSATAAGNYFVLFVADHLNQVSEADETNNVRSRPLTVLPASVDLVMQQPSIAPTTTQAGALVNAYSIIYNQGNSTASSSTVGYYLSTNATLDAADVLLSQTTGFTLFGFSSSSRYGSFNVPASTAPGNYFVLFVADPLNQVTETNENNNVASAPLTVAPSGVDLAVQQEQLFNSTATAGTTVGVAAYVVNLGNLTAATSNLGYYLSTNTTFDSGDQLMGSSTGGQLFGGGSSYRSTNITVPAGTAPGNYYVLFVADHLNQVSEVDENNNVRSRFLTIITPNVDLAMYQPSVNPQTTASGNTVGTFVTIFNQGNTQALSSNVGYYLSTNATLDASDVLLSQSTNGGPLNANSSSSRSVNVLIPANTAVGSYFVLFVADPLNQVTETNENNNVVSAQLTVVAPGVDLTVQQPFLSRVSAAAGATLQTNATVVNQGTTTANNSTLGYYLSTDVTLSANDVAIGTTPVFPVTAGNGQVVYGSVTIPAATTPGSYFVLFAADATNIISETNEQNNVANIPLTITAPFNGLVVPYLSQASVTTCSNTVYDHGGTDDYDNGASGTLVINPATAGAKVRLTFTLFSLENGFDYVRVYDGPTAQAPQLGSFTGTANPGVITASAQNTSGALTIVFTTDGSVTSAGFEATISCFTTALPDLTITQASATPTTVASGGQMTASFTISNIGPGIAGSSPVSYFLSTNTTLDASDRLIGTIGGGSLSNGQTVSRSSPVTVPSNVATGAYYLLCVADGGGVVPETNENNNVATPIAITVQGAAPDLALSSPTVAPGTVAAGNVVVTTCFHENLGQVDAGVHTLAYYLSTDNQLSANDVLLRSVSYTAMAAGAGNTRSNTVTVPAGTVPGNYFLLYVVDAQSQITESNEQNNLVSRPLVVTVGTAVREQTAGFAIGLYPNPVVNGQDFAVHFAGQGANTEAELTLLNSVGQVVSRRQVTLRPGAAPVVFDTDGLAHGVYTLRISGKNLNAVRRVVFH